MKKTKGYLVVIIIFVIMLSAFLYGMFKIGIITNINDGVNKLSGSIASKKVGKKPQILEIINSSGEEKSTEDVVLFIDALSDSNIKVMQYSFDNKKWYKIGDMTKEGNVTTGKVVFTKNMKTMVYVRVIDEYNKMSKHASTKVYIEK